MMVIMASTKIKILPKMHTIGLFLIFGVLQIIAEDPSPITVNPGLDILDEKFAKCGKVNIRELGVLDFQLLLDQGILTSEQLTRCFLERLDRLNPILRVVVEVNVNVLEEAKKLDDERKAGKVRSKLHGIPVLIKDQFGTVNDGTQTTIGSPALLGLVPKQNAKVVETMKQAGALILGKSHCQEYFGFRGTNIPNGWSGRGGQTRNAYNLSVTPEGSSSGSGVAVAANLVPVAVGSETDGSIIAPANLLGIVGMKPTFGLVSLEGAIPLSHNQDHAGPMAKSVMDAAILLDAMVTSEDRPKDHPPSYAQHLKDDEVKQPIRVGVLREPFWNTEILVSDELEYQIPLLNKLLDTLNSSEAFEVVDPVEVPFHNISVAKLYTVFYHDFKENLNKYLQTKVVNNYSLERPQNPVLQTPEAYYSAVAPEKKIESLADIIKYNEEHPTPQGYNQENLIMSQATDGLDNATYIEARDSNKKLVNEYLELIFEQYNLDLIVTPSESRVYSVKEGTYKDFPVFGFSIACMAGYPTINVPAGIGLRSAPFGMTLMGKRLSEPALLTAAYQVEKLTQQRKPPKFLI